MSELRIMSMNCRGLGSQEKRRDVVHYIKNSSFDVVFLQDTHLTNRTIPFFNTLWKGKCYHSCKSSNSRGSTILIKSSVPHEVLAEKHCPIGNFVILVCKIRSNVYTMISVYGPNEDNPRFYEILEEHIESIPSENIIFGGDFNFVMNHEKDSNYLHDNNCNAKAQFISTMNKYDLVDIWRQLHPDERQFTWLKRNPLKYGRLDMFIISEHLRNYITRCDVAAGYRTDHSIISFSLKEPDQERGSYLWKFNESLLDDSIYLQVIKDSITETVMQYAVPIYTNDFLSDSANYNQIQFTIDIGLFYETLLMMLRGETVKYAKEKARKCRQAEHKLVQEINDLRNRLPEQMSERSANQLEVLQNKLEEMRAPKIKGLITRSRVKWYDQGERCSKYFLSLEKSNCFKKSIQCLRSNDKILSKKSDILNELTAHFTSKYSVNTECQDPTNYLQRNIKRKLNETQKATLDEPLTLGELSSALTSMKKGKSPGVNGFTAPFFKQFWSYLGIFLLRVFNHNITEGHLINSFREGVITLIPKAGKPADTVKGWRPISLLNTDFKIISAAITHRLKSVMGDLISPVQSAYLKGRYIGENTRLVYDVIDSLNNNGESGIILAADFESAFEAVSWPFLLEALDQYNFGPYYKHLLKIVYLDDNNFSRIMLDGFLGEKIYLRQGIRQGDPASGYLFNLVVEPLANQIMQSEKVNGISIKNNFEVRVSQYADDLILFMDPKINYMLGAIEELKMFSSFSGLRVNVSKTKCMPIGNAGEVTNMNSQEFTFVDEIKILGVTFNNKNHDITNINIESKLPLIRKEIAQWNRRHLSLLGKVTVIKSLLLSKLVHIFIALPRPSPSMIKRIETLLFQFLWNNRSDLVKRAKVTQPYGCDGLRMVDVGSFIKSMKIGWIKRLYWSSQQWAQLIKLDLPPVELMLTYGSKKMRSLTKTLTYPFWVEVIHAWADFIELRKPDSAELLTDSLWCSDHTKYKYDIVKSWDNKGLRFINDLINPSSGRLLGREELEHKYSINMTFLCYHSLIRSLPAEIRNQTRIQRLQLPIISYKLTYVARNVELTREAYREFVRALKPKYNEAQQLWQNKWVRDIGTAYEGSMYDIRAATDDTYIQSFHFKIVSRVITTNRFLHLIGRSDHESCTFCSDASETLKHMFWTCPIVQTFINMLKLKVYEQFSIHTAFEETTWFFPNLGKLNKFEMLIITLAKLVIYKARNISTRPDVRHFLRLLRIQAEKEQGSARGRNRMNEFNEKWGNARSVLTLEQ